MNVFDFALKMEADGEKYYRELAVKTKYEELKVVLNGLADDEQRHYKIVQELQKRNGNSHFETDPALSKAENGFELGKNKTFMTKDKDSIVKLKAEQLDVYRAALCKEEESIQTYKKLKETAEQQTEKDILEKIGHEEERHAEVLDNIIQMLNNANEWVESAEFNHTKPY